MGGADPGTNRSVTWACVTSFGAEEPDPVLQQNTFPCERKGETGMSVALPSPGEPSARSSVPAYTAESVYSLRN